MKLNYSFLVGKRVFTLDLYKNKKDGRNEEWSQMIYTVTSDLCTILGHKKKTNHIQDQASYTLIDYWL